MSLSLQLYTENSSCGSGRSTRHVPNTMPVTQSPPRLCSRLCNLSPLICFSCQGSSIWCIPWIDIMPASFLLPVSLCWLDCIVCLKGNTLREHLPQGNTYPKGNTYPNGNAQREMLTTLTTKKKLTTLTQREMLTLLTQKETLTQRRCLPEGKCLPKGKCPKGNTGPKHLVRI